MISQADLKVISTVFGKTLDEISGALSSDQEVSLDLRLNGKVITDEQQKEIKETAVKQGKEIGYKDVAKALEIDLDAGEKDPVKIAEKLKTNLSSVLEEKYKTQTPTEELLNAAKKATEWEEKYKTLFTTHKEKEKEVDEWKTKYTSQEQKIKDESLNNKILSVLPEKLGIDKSDALLIIKNSLRFADENGKTHIYNGDKLIADPVGEPEDITNVIPSFAEQKGWIKKEGGMSGSDRGGGQYHPKGYSADQAMKYLKEKEISPASPEGLKIFNELTLM
jgi:hypothetical protein